jgi:hypothetical protein
MAEPDLPYLWFYKSHYPSYRRRKQLIALKVPDGERLLRGDFGKWKRYERIHKSFGAAQSKECVAIMPSSSRVWEDEQVERFYKRLPPESIQRVIFDMFLCTGQCSGQKPAGEIS